MNGKSSSGLHEWPAVLPAELVPGIHVARVAGLAATLLLGERVVVVVHHEAEVLVVDNATIYLLDIVCSGRVLG